MGADASRYALVRDVPDSYSMCERPPGHGEAIDVDLARQQHAAYRAALEGAGLRLVRLPADERFPDCCFVEDTSIILGGTAIIARMGAPSRRGEERAVREVLAGRMGVLDILPPATIDGGDVLVLGDRVYVGLGGRTNLEGCEQVREAAGEGYRVTPVPLEGVLHLKSVCTHVGGRCLLIRPGHFDISLFADYDLVRVPGEEAYAANCLSLGDRVLVSAGYPVTRQAIERAGFCTVALEMSEFRKGQGSLTCLSKMY
jgi:dimethylargininase